MTGALPASAAALLLLAPTTVTAMTDEPHALTLDVREDAGTIVVQLVGFAPEARQVSYALEVTGQSTSRHKGKTMLAAGTRAVLSTLRATAGENWCVTLQAEEEGREPYEVTQGNCAK